MNSDPPRYIPPAPDPGLAILAQQNEQAKLGAIQDRVSAASARLMQQFGTRIAMGGEAPAVPLLMPGFAMPQAGSGVVIAQPTYSPNVSVSE